MKRRFNYLMVLILFATISACSKVGSEGPIGKPGERGEKGEIGTQGIPGTDGQVLLYGNRAPVAGDGKNGDFFIDKNSNKLYGPKASGAWGAGANLKGDTGATGSKGDSGSKGDTGSRGSDGRDGSNGKNGSQFLAGSGNPTTIGEISDFYLNTTSGQLFGPKTASGWGTGVSLKGAKGDKGDTGNANVTSYTFFVQRANWSGNYHYGENNIFREFIIPNNLVGNNSISAIYNNGGAVLIYGNVEDFPYTETRLLPLIFSKTVNGDTFGLKVEFSPKYGRLYLSKTTKGYNNLLIDFNEMPASMFFKVVLIEGKNMSQMKGKVDLSDFNAVTKYLSLQK